MRSKMLKFAILILVLAAFSVIPLGVLFGQQNVVIFQDHQCDNNFRVIVANDCVNNNANACLGQVETVNVINGRCIPVEYYDTVCRQFVVPIANGQVQCVLVAWNGMFSCAPDPNAPQQNFLDCV